MAGLGSWVDLIQCSKSTFYRFPCRRRNLSRQSISSQYPLSKHTHSKSHLQKKAISFRYSMTILWQCWHQVWVHLLHLITIESLAEQAFQVRCFQSLLPLILLPLPHSSYRQRWHQYLLQFSHHHFLPWFLSLLLSQPLHFQLRVCFEIRVRLLG